MKPNEKNLKPLMLFFVAKPYIYSYANLLGNLEKNREIMANFDIAVRRQSIFEFKWDDIKEIKKLDPNHQNIFDRPYIILNISMLSMDESRLEKLLTNDLITFKNLMNNSRVILIAGGWHVTGKFYDVLKKGAEFVIIGESEYIYPLLLEYIHDYLHEKNYEGPQNINSEEKIQALKKFITQNLLDYKEYNQTGGKSNEMKRVHRYENLAEQTTDFLKFNHIGFEYNGKIVYSDKKFPLSDPRCSVNLDLYQPFSERFRVFCPIEISRGCPFRCKFCQTGNYYDQMRHASVDTIVKWVKKAVEIKYDKVWFLSPNSFAYASKNGTSVKPLKVRELLSRVKKINGLNQIFFGTFPSEVRPDFVNTEVLDAVHGLISNKYFSVGAQTASDKLLKKINRGHTFDDVLNAIDLILDYGYGIDLDFIFGLPEETREDKLKTIEFFKETLVSGKNIRIHTHTFMPLPGTPYENMPLGELDKEIEVIISKLEGQKKAFGQHREQAKIYKNL